MRTWYSLLTISLLRDLKWVEKPIFCAAQAVTPTRHKSDLQISATYQVTPREPERHHVITTLPYNLNGGQSHQPRLDPSAFEPFSRRRKWEESIDKVPRAVKYK